MSLQCPNCGVKNADDAVYCIWCHKELSKQESKQESRDLKLDQGNAKKPEILDDSLKAEVFPTKFKKIIRLIVLILILITLFTIWSRGNKATLSKVDNLFKKTRQKILGFFKGGISPKVRFKIGSRSNSCKINGILYSDETPFVMIGGTIYYPDDSVCGGTILNISQNEVIIQLQDKQGIYRVGSIVK